MPSSIADAGEIGQMARRKRVTHYFGLTAAAAFNEWDRSLAVGSVENEPIFGTVTFRPASRLVGKPATSLLASLDAIRGDRALAPRDRAAAYDAVLEKRCSERASAAPQKASTTPLPN
jgi:hypothetical protein